MLSYIFLITFFLLPFLTWPGFGSTILLSPLDIFLLENYPLWFIAFYPFVLGITVEVPSAWLLTRLYMTKIFPLLLKDGGKSRKISFMQFSLGIISCLPLIIMFLYFVVLDFNPLSLTLIYLAQLKGSSEKYYYGHLDMAVTSWFTSGILFTLFVASFYLRNLFLKKLEERGVKVRESGLEGKSSFFKFFKFATIGATGFGLAILLFFLPHNSSRNICDDCSHYIWRSSRRNLHLHFNSNDHHNIYYYFIFRSPSKIFKENPLNPQFINYSNILLTFQLPSINRNPNPHSLC